MTSDRGLRDSYDRVAGEYARHLLDELDHKPLDRGLLAAFAETAPPGPIADLGCGPGQVASHLHRLGRQVIGIDLSPAMVETARRLCPGPEYHVGTLLNLALAGGSLGGAVAFYSIVHLTLDQLPAAFAELRRTLRPEGVALLAFHTGSHVVHLDSWWDHPVSIDFHFHPPGTVRRHLEAAGLTVEWDLRRQPGAGEVQTERCYLLARRPAITVRPATEADRGFLRALHHACWRPLVEPLWGWAEADQDRRFEAAFSVAGRSVVELAGRPIGTLRVGRTGPEGPAAGLRVEDIQVEPAHQRRGIGTSLLRGVLAEADREGLPVRVRLLRAAPRRLYERLGFAVEGETASHVLLVRQQSAG